MRPSPRSPTSAVAAMLAFAGLALAVPVPGASPSFGVSGSISSAPAPAPTPSPAPKDPTPPTPASTSSTTQSPALDPEADIAAARADLVTRLVGVAQWCHKVELFEESDKLWTQILTLDAKNIEAHKGLGHARSSDGSWHESNRHVYKNRSTKPLAELPAKRAEAIKPYAEALVARAKEAKDEAVRNTYLSAVLAIDPDDPTVHQFQGDAREGDRWVLPETVGAKDRRAALKQLVQSSIDGAPATKPEKPDENDPKPAFEWKLGVTTGSVRVLTTGSEEDAQQIARTCTAAGAIVKGLLGDGFEFPAHMTFYVLDPTQKEALLSTLKGLDETDLAAMRKMEGAGVPHKQDVALWTGNKARTLDMAVRQTLSFLFNRGIGLTPSCGWVWEGFGLYLTREITGTRLTWFVPTDTSATAAASAALLGKLRANDANWMNEALTLLTAADGPKVGDVMKESLAQMKVRDAVVGYALAAYLVESRPDIARDFAKRCSDGEQPDVVTRSLLSMTPDELQKRLVRWLTERK